MFNPDYTEQLRPAGHISIQDAERGRQKKVLEDFRQSHPGLVAKGVERSVALKLANQAYNEVEAEIAERVTPGGMRDIREAIEVEANKALKIAAAAPPPKVETVKAPTGVQEGAGLVPRTVSSKPEGERGTVELTEDDEELVPKTSAL